MAIFIEVTENYSINNRHALVKGDNLTAWAVIGKRCEIGCKLVLFTNRKSHTGFPLVSKSMTLNGVMTSDARYLCGSWASCLQSPTSCNRVGRGNHNLQSESCKMTTLVHIGDVSGTSAMHLVHSLSVGSMQCSTYEGRRWACLLIW